MINHLPREIQELIYAFDPTYHDKYKRVVAGIRDVLRIPPPKFFDTNSSTEVDLYTAYLHPAITLRDGSGPTSFIVQRRNQWCFVHPVVGGIGHGIWVRPHEALLRYKVDTNADFGADTIDDFADTMIEWLES